MQGTLFLPEREKSGRSGPHSHILPWFPTIRSIHPSMRDEWLKHSRFMLESLY